MNIYFQMNIKLLPNAKLYIIMQKKTLSTNTLLKIVNLQKVLSLGQVLNFAVRHKNLQSCDQCEQIVLLLLIQGGL